MVLTAKYGIMVVRKLPVGTVSSIITSTARYYLFGGGNK